MTTETLRLIRSECNLICHAGRCRKLCVLQLLTFMQFFIIQSASSVNILHTKMKKNPAKKAVSLFSRHSMQASWLQSDSACEVTLAALLGSVRCGFHWGGPRAHCHLPVLLGHRLTCWDSCESPYRQVGAELRYLLSSCQDLGWELELDPWDLLPVASSACGRR